MKSQTISLVEHMKDRGLRLSASTACVPRSNAGFISISNAQFTTLFNFSSKGHPSCSAATTDLIRLMKLESEEIAKPAWPQP